MPGNKCINNAEKQNDLCRFTYHAVFCSQKLEELSSQKINPSQTDPSP